MKKRLFLGFCIVISLPIAIHFFQLYFTLENTPTWSDDFLFSEMIPDLFDRAITKSLVSQLFASHNEINRIAFARIWVALYYLIAHEINFKNLILLANLQMIVILIHQYDLFIRRWMPGIVVGLLFSSEHKKVVDLLKLDGESKRLL